MSGVLRHPRYPNARSYRYQRNQLPRADCGRDGGRGDASHCEYRRGGNHRIFGVAEGGIHGDQEIKMWYL